MPLGEVWEVWQRSDRQTSRVEPADLPARAGKWLWGDQPLMESEYEGYTVLTVKTNHTNIHLHHQNNPGALGYNGSINQIEAYTDKTRHSL